MQVLIDYLQNLNWLAVVVAAAAAFFVNFIWYSRGLFGKAWMKSAGIKEVPKNKQPSMIRPLLIGAGSELVLAAAMAVLFDVLALKGILDGALLGVLVAIGFLIANRAMHSNFEGRPTTYRLITDFGDLLAMVVMGVVIALFA